MNASYLKKFYTTRKRGSSFTHLTLVLRATSFEVHELHRPTIIRLSSDANSFSNSQRIRSSCRLVRRHRNTEYCKLSPYPLSRVKHRRHRLGSRMS